MSIETVKKYLFQKNLMNLVDSKADVTTYETTIYLKSIAPYMVKKILARLPKGVEHFDDGYGGHLFGSVETPAEKAEFLKAQTSVIGVIALAKAKESKMLLEKMKASALEWKQAANELEK